MKQSVIEIKPAPPSTGQGNGVEDDSIYAEVEYQAYTVNNRGLKIGAPQVRIRVTKGEWVTIDRELLNYRPELYGTPLDKIE